MGGRTSKSRARPSHLELSKASQGKVPEAVAGKGIELPPNYREQSQVGGDLAQRTMALKRRQSDAASTNEPLPTKRARLTRTDAQTGLRRSARLHRPQHSPCSKGPRIVPPAPSYGPQIEAHTASGPLASKRTGLTQTNTPQRRVEHQEGPEAVKQPKPSKRPDTSSVEPKADGPERVSSATRLQKRQIGSDDNGRSDDNEHQPKRARLTRKNLALFDRMAEKKGINTASSTPLESTVDSSTRTTSTTTAGFAIKVRKNGILRAPYSKPPTNLEDIRNRFAGSRETPSPTESVYKRYINRIEGVPNEATMVVEVSGKLLKEYDDEGYQRAFNQVFTAFPKDVGFNNGLSAPQPDFVEGLRMEEYLPFPIDTHIGGAVLYKDNPYSLTLPHLVGEWKGSGKDMTEARLQSAYNGAALVYARNRALSLIGESDPPGHAKVTTFTTDGTNLNFFAHYTALSEDDTLEYHQYPIDSINLANSHQQYKDGRRAIRNAQDYAKKQSYALKDQLKGHWKQRRGAC